MVPEILTSTIVPIPWSDHNAVCTSSDSPIPKSHDPTWCLPDSVVKHPTHQFDIEHALKEYLALNTTPDISLLTLWEAHKPVLRGAFQCQSTLFNRERQNLARKLESDFLASYTAFSANPTPAAKNKLDKARLEYYLFFTESSDKSLRCSRHTYYMKSNKPDTLLACTLKSINNKKVKPPHTSPKLT